MNSPNKKRVKLHEETDAEIARSADSTWIGVKDFSIYIKKTDEGVVVDIYARDFEDCDCLASTYAFDSEAEEMREEIENEVD
jgi:hypothetical protein